MIIDTKVHQIINDLKAIEGKLGFGSNLAPIMYIAEYANNEWLEAKLKEYAPIAVDPAAKILHYAQSIFEGMKAYKTKAGNLQLFRPELNYKRFNLSAARMSMPQLPKNLFFEGIEQITKFCNKIIPTNSGQSLYLRPFMFGTTGELGLASASNYIFSVIASPSDGIHSGSMQIFVSEDACRSVLGGTGAVKAGANYAMSLQTTHNVKQNGYDQVMWLDPEHRKYIEELSGMNVFFKIGDQLHTPKLTGSFLAGITRQSIIDLAKANGLTVVERNIDIAQLCQQIESKNCTSGFACGTATIVSPIQSLTFADKLYSFNEDYSLAASFKQQLLDIQEGNVADTMRWMHLVS